MNDLWREVTRLRNSIAELAETIRKHDEALANCIGRMKAEIEKGGTTGDLILDFFITQFGTIDEETMKPLRELEAQMAGKVGQLFLVIQNVKDRWMFGPGGDNEFCFKKEYLLGVLSSDKVFFKDRQYGLQTQVGCVGMDVRGGSYSTTAPYFLFPICKGIHPPNRTTLGVESREEFEVVVGDSEVAERAKWEIEKDMFRALVGALGKEWPE